jgi:pimeloyl-ACP methyl ester carboxylesterase
MTIDLPELDGVEHRFVDAGGLRTHVAVTGDGPPLVLLHGWPQHWWAWHKVVPLLRDRFRLIMPDLRGHGWTAAPPGGYEKHQLARDVVALLDALRIDRVRLVGHDWGGWTGFLLALEHAERIERFMALNIPPPWPGRPSVRSLTLPARMTYQYVLAGPLGPRAVRDGRLVRWMLTVDHRTPGAMDEHDVDRYVEVLRAPERARATQQLYRSFLTRELPRVVTGRYTAPRLRVPTRILFGAGDLAIDQAMVQGHERRADDLDVEIIERSGHFIAEEQPALVADRVAAFLG